MHTNTGPIPNTDMNTMRIEQSIEHGAWGMEQGDRIQDLQFVEIKIRPDNTSIQVIPWSDISN
jgi:hypothetical protein